MTSAQQRQTPPSATSSHAARPAQASADAERGGLKSQLAGKSYDEQVQMLSPGGSGPETTARPGSAPKPPTKEQLASAKPAILFANTDADPGDQIAKKLCGFSDQIVTVQLTFRQLARFGATGKLPLGVTPSGEKFPRDYVEVNGQPMNGAGGTTGTAFVDGATGDSAPIVFRLSNNGLLNLHRIAVAAKMLAEKNGGTEKNGWRIDAKTSLDIFIGMKVSNDPKKSDARDYGTLSGITPHDLTPMFNTAWKSAATAFVAAKAGNERAAKERIHETHMQGRLHREHKPDHPVVTPGMSWTDETRAKLNYALGSVLTDEGRPTPILYIPNRIDFTAAIDALFARGEVNGPHAVAAFMADIKQLLKQHVDLSWLEGTDPAFAARFLKHWQDNLDKAFAGSVLFKNIEHEFQTMAQKREYYRQEYEVKAPNSTVVSNASGRVDGKGRSGKTPDMRGWGPERVAEPEDVEEEAGLETADGNVAERLPPEAVTATRPTRPAKAEEEPLIKVRQTDQGSRGNAGDKTRGGRGGRNKGRGEVTSRAKF